MPTNNTSHYTLARWTIKPSNDLMTCRKCTVDFKISKSPNHLLQLKSRKPLQQKSRKPVAYCKQFLSLLYSIFHNITSKISHDTSSTTSPKVPYHLYQTSSLDTVTTSISIPLISLATTNYFCISHSGSGTCIKWPKISTQHWPSGGGQWWMNVNP